MAKVLIIANEKIMRSSLKAAVQHEGYEVDVASDGYEGFQKISQNSYDIAFCDLYLPKLGCIELLEKIKGFNLPLVIMVSVKNDIETLIHLIEKGAFELISKPINLNRFTIILRNALNYATLSRKSDI